MSKSSLWVCVAEGGAKDLVTRSHKMSQKPRTVRRALAKAAAARRRARRRWRGRVVEEGRMSRHEVAALVVGTVALISGKVGSSERKEDVVALGSRAIEECFQITLSFFLWTVIP
jgi:hypothetical protein